MVFASPAIVFAIGVASIILLLVKFKVPAFIGLIISALIVGVATVEIPVGDVPAETATAFGDTMGDIGIPILMAAVIGKSMMDSGAAQRIVRSFQSVTGEEQSYLALGGASGLLSIPVFFDNVLFLLTPLARSMRAKRGQDYALFLTIVGAAGVVTHSFVPPTPGPLAVASSLNVDLGIMMLVGLIVSVPTILVAGVAYSKWINKQLDDIPLRESMGSTGESLEELGNISTSELPGLFESLLPILLAVLLIGANTTVDAVALGGGLLTQLTGFVGDPNIALTAAAIAAAVTYLRIRSFSRDVWSDELVEALKDGGHMAAITCAGGAFGSLLAASGIGGYIANILTNLGLPLLVAGFVIAAAVRIAQGSGTVAILTTGEIMASLVSDLTVHPVYLALMIGAGATIFSWYNDSAFWIVKEIGGLTQRETLKIYTGLTTIASLTGFATILLLSALFPIT